MLFAVIKKKLENCIVTLKKISLNDNYYKRCLISFFITTILMIITYNVFPVFFEENDDNAMMSLAAGYYTGIPTAYILFSNYIYGLILKTLYILVPSVGWYLIVVQVLFFVANFTICKSLMQLANKKNFSVWIAILGYIIFYLIFLMPPQTLINFTSVSGILGTAALMAVISMDISSGRFTTAIDIMLFVFLIFFSYCVRKEIFYMFFCYIAVAIIYRILSNREERKRICILFACTCLLSGMCIYTASYVNSKAYSTKEWIDFQNLNESRFDYMTLNRPSYDLNKDIYEYVGWSEELHDIVNNWFFMDSKISLETFDIINQYNNVSSWWSTLFTDLSKSVKVMIGNLNNFLSYQGFYCMGAIFIFIFSFFHDLKLYINKKKKDYLELIFLLSIVGGCAIFIIVLCITPKLWFRYFYAIVSPAALVCLYLSFINCNELPKYSGYIKKNLTFFVAIIVCVGSCFLFSKYIGKEYFVKSETTEKIVEEFAIENEKNIYIMDYDLIQFNSATIVYPEKKPYNIFFWGSWQYGSPIFQEKLKICGIDEWSSEVFLKDNVYLYSKKPTTAFSDYMTSEFGALDFNIVDTLKTPYETIFVYKINKPNV